MQIAKSLSLDEMFEELKERGPVGLSLEDLEEEHCECVSPNICERRAQERKEKT